MPTSIREQLLAAITTAVSGKYGIPSADAFRDLPVTIVVEGEEVATQEEHNVDTMEMEVAVAKGAEVPETVDPTDTSAIRSQAHELLAAARQAMFADETFGGLATSVQYSGGGIQSDLTRIVFAEAQFVVRYQTVRGDPYTLA